MPLRTSGLLRCRAAGTSAGTRAPTYYTIITSGLVRRGLSTRGHPVRNRDRRQGHRRVLPLGLPLGLRPDLHQAHRRARLQGRHPVRHLGRHLGGQVRWDPAQRWWLGMSYRTASPSWEGPTRRHAQHVCPGRLPRWRCDGEGAQIRGGRTRTKRVDRIWYESAARCET